MEDGIDLSDAAGDTFWDDPLGDLLTYLCEHRPWDNKIVAIAHNARAVMRNLRPAGQMRPPEILYPARATFS